MKLTTTFLQNGKSKNLSKCYMLKVLKQATHKKQALFDCSCKKDDKDILVVMLNSEHRWNDVKTIFEDVLPDLTDSKPALKKASRSTKSQQKAADSSKKTPAKKGSKARLAELFKISLFPLFPSPLALSYDASIALIKLSLTCPSSSFAYPAAVVPAGDITLSFKSAGCSFLSTSPTPSNKVAMY